MSAKEISEKVKQKIFDSWLDHQVAHWVIDQLKLLNLESSRVEATILSLSSTGEISDPSIDFSKKLNFIISGGLEGTVGHVAALTEIYEAKILMDANLDREVTLLLEPDSYIKNKGREVLVSQAERAVLWANSGLADCVIMLPDEIMNVDRYAFLEKLFEPAIWFVTIDNPGIKEIRNRTDFDGIYAFQIIKLLMKPHASFLAETQLKKKWKVLNELYQYLESLDEDIRELKSRVAQEPPICSQYYQQRLDIIFNAVSEGLR